ncbi:MAG: flavodoxin family protein [Spirochaetaceae bacterium]|nr:flavodoxin family protein [Spirochaetaceae bacterium]
MDVILINGSPREKQCTYTALMEIAKALNEDGINTQIIHLGSAEKCNDNLFVSNVARLVENSDGLIVGTPVYYSAATGMLSMFMTNLISRCDKLKLALKPAATIASARRAGSISAIDQINKFFMYAQMPIVSSNYWPMVYGLKASDVEKDLEGLQIMRTLGHNMAWMIKSFAIAKVDKPVVEKLIRTNFID